MTAGDLAWWLPGDDAYAQATSPNNTTAEQRPAAVARIRGDDDALECVAAARGDGLRIAVQATGHGAAGRLGSDTVLADTSGLNAIDIDADTRVARVGSGVTWGELTQAAARHGMLGLAGTAPDVGVTGYVLHGGWGWLARPFGVASARLRAVTVIDGHGRRRRAEPERDTELLWVCRGGGGAGLITELELELVEAGELWGGYGLWSLDEVSKVASGWSERVESLPESATSILTQMRLPDAPTAPASLRGHVSTYLGVVASAEDSGEVERLLDLLPAPAAETFGPLDPTRLMAIHLDPPRPGPSRGDGRWLTDLAATITPDLFATASAAGDETLLAAVELRHCGVSAPGAPGALTTSPSPFLLHVVGLATDPETAVAIDAAQGEVIEAARPADSDRPVASFRDGRTSAIGALDPAVEWRVERVLNDIDPEGRFAPARRLLPPRQP